MTMREFANPAEAYLVGYSEGGQDAHARFVGVLGMMQMRRATPDAATLPAHYQIKCIGGTLQLLALNADNHAYMASDGWSVSIHSDERAQAVQALIEEYYKRKAAGTLDINEDVTKPRRP